MDKKKGSKKDNKKTSDPNMTSSNLLGVGYWRILDETNGSIQQARPQVGSRKNFQPMIRQLGTTNWAYLALVGPMYRINGSTILPYRHWVSLCVCAT